MYKKHRIILWNRNKNLLFWRKKFAECRKRRFFFVMMTNEKNEKRSKCIKKQLHEL